MLKAYVDSIFQCRLEASSSRQYLHTTLRWLVTKSPLNLTIKRTESSVWKHKTTGDHHRAACMCMSVCACFHCNCVGFFVHMMGGGMYHPIRIISVTALNIFNSKDAVGVGEGCRRGCESLLELPVSQVCLSARCLTLTGAGDECNLWQPMELTDSWESQLPEVKVSIFKAHQLQWEGSRTAHMPALTVKQENFLISVYCYTTHINK